MSSDDQLWIGRGDMKLGPYTEINIRQWLASGELTKDDLAWRSGMTSWVPLMSLISPAPSVDMPPPLPGNVTTGGTQSPTISRADRVNNGFTSATTRADIMIDDLMGRRSGYSANNRSSDDRKAFPSPPSMHWGFVVLLSFLTFGIFSIIWLFIQANWIRRIDDESNATALLAGSVAVFIVTVAFDVGAFLTSVNGIPNIVLISFGGLIGLINLVIIMIAVFSMANSTRTSLRAHGVDLRIGGITLFFFNTLYLQALFNWINRWKNTGRVSDKPPKAIFWVLFVILPLVIEILAGVAIYSYQIYTPITSSTVNETASENSTSGELSAIQQQPAIATVPSPVADSVSSSEVSHGNGEGEEKGYNSLHPNPRNLAVAKTPADLLKQKLSFPEFTDAVRGHFKPGSLAEDISASTIQGGFNYEVHHG